MKNEKDYKILSYTTDIVTAYLENSSVKVEEIPNIIDTVYIALSNVEEKEYLQSEEFEPAVLVKDSIKDDYLVCLEDGKKLKMLKRYLRTTYNMSPEEYRQKWNLPPDYPMVAPNYAKLRSKLAKKTGLGK